MTDEATKRLEVLTAAALRFRVATEALKAADAAHVRTREALSVADHEHRCALHCLKAEQDRFSEAL